MPQDEDEQVGDVSDPSDAADDSAGRPGEDLRSDAELIARLRGRGADRDSTDAFATLYGRHQQAARALARQLARSPADVDDLVAGAFTRMLEILRAGRGPTEAFRAYLLTSVRHLAYDRSRAERRLDLTDDITDVHGIDPDGTIVPFTDPAIAGLERTLAAQAFATLPERWQAVLWHLEVEGDSPADIAPLFGLTANAVSALGYRAREGLRQAYLQEHLASGSGRWDRRHRETGEKLGAYTRGGLARREAQRVEAHLAECGECRALADELHDVNAGMIRSVVAPLVLGAGLVGYLASRGSTGPLAFDASTGELAIAGGGALGVLGALTGLTGAPRPAAPTRIGVAGALGLAGVVGVAAFVVGDVVEPPASPPQAAPWLARPPQGAPGLALPPMALLPPRLPGVPVAPPNSPMSPSSPMSPTPVPRDPALAVPDLAGPGAGEAGGTGNARSTGSRTAATVSAGADRAAVGTERTAAGADRAAAGTGRTATRSPSDTTPRSADRTPARSAARSGPASAGGPDGESATGPATAALVVLAPERTRRAAADCAVTTRLPVLGSAGVVCPTGRAEREASLDSRR
ncbi:sigma-70 family RNA polymerase sigma factor [Actinomycetospora callitridis]|uniref:sigma-70 family RNA polymerase sigma factor n=1 Tax=Actinomycetospora callitridis TaxID=913944 RepID=UPI002366F773|nr:sigma-70 family RNA polymerase sigma factor [Actinomycetospora callitridis]MDD7916522.1 sigma-70 family RNA polymerase sigma factor [Actinomycetospora callitridis]